MNINLLSKAQSFTGERFILTHEGWEQIDEELYEFLNSQKSPISAGKHINATNLSNNEVEREKTAITQVSEGMIE